MSRRLKTALVAAPIAALITLVAFIYSLVRFIEQVDGDIAQFAHEDDDIDYTAYAEEWGIWF